MTISFSSATKALLSGKTLAWRKFGQAKPSKITLNQPGQRRLFAYLLSQDASKVATCDEALFPDLIAAWVAEDDPADTEVDADVQQREVSAWRLQRIETSNFGGLNLFGGPDFDFWVGESNWCILGQNGSGKTSLTSAILWALSGYRIREQDGPIDEKGAREPVTSTDGKKVGEWPPFAAYPQDPLDLIQIVDVWVRLTFQNETGDTATAYRCLTSPELGTPSVKIEIDPRLSALNHLVETSVLMPARLSRIGLGKQSQSLYDAVKFLTGLDQLADIADGAGAIGNAGRRFLKYGKENGLESHAARYSENIEKAETKAKEIDFMLPENLDIDHETIVADLKAAAIAASGEAGEHLATLEAEVEPTVDMSTIAGRNSINAAVNTARGVVNQGGDGIILFEMWTALGEAGEDNNLKDFPAVVASADDKLDRALAWHARQINDNKFRLKALAAQFYLPPHRHTDSAHCPLCESILQTTQQKELAKELAELKADAVEAERKLDDVCREVESELIALLPAGLRRHLDGLSDMNPKTGYAEAVRRRFCTAPPFSTLLLGLRGSINKKVDDQAQALPNFEYPAFVNEKAEPQSAMALRKKIHSLSRLVALTTWWQGHRQVFRNAWQEIIGQKQEDGRFPVGSVEGHLAVLEAALHKATPLDELSKLLQSAADTAKAWAPIAAEQARRVAIAEALKPLKELRLLVTVETTRSITELSDRLGSILDRIHHQERLSYRRTALERKTVMVDGSFEPGMHIDAALVANTSWLRAILWAFLLALREQIIEGMGRNPFPLLVLDDPQTTFDPRNKRDWSKELARLANLARTEAEGVQLLLTTHERQFFQIMIDTEKLSGEQGMMGGANKASRVSKIVNGGALDRVFQEAEMLNDDAKARDYVAKVRIYCEDLLKFMLRGHGAHIPSLTLGDLAAELNNQISAHTIPFSCKPFIDLVNTISGGGGRPMKYINDLHHKDDESYGVAQAREVKDFWESTLRSQIQDAFELFDTYESFYGEPRTFPWARNVVLFPEGHRADIKGASMHLTGIAAAAKTDGVAGDGVFTLDEWNEAEPVTLHSHEVYQLVASTLDPVAGVGDVVIVCSHAPIHPRNLVVAAVGETLLARRYNEMGGHPGIAILTAQSVDPTALAEPVIIALERKNCRKIVGTLFLNDRILLSGGAPKHEVAPLTDARVVKQVLDGARLFGVKGRSAEPIALDGQYLITRSPVTSKVAMQALDGRTVVAIDDSGARYFKRLRCSGKFVVLESLNPDGTTPSEIMTFDGAPGTLKLTQLLEVIGVLFELPKSAGS